jgi:hypothetical protein
MLLNSLMRLPLFVPLLQLLLEHQLPLLLSLLLEPLLHLRQLLLPPLQLLYQLQSLPQLLLHSYLQQPCQPQPLLLYQMQSCLQQPLPPLRSCQKSPLLQQLVLQYMLHYKQVLALARVQVVQLVWQEVPKLLLMLMP